MNKWLIVIFCIMTLIMFAINPVVAGLGIMAVLVGYNMQMGPRV